MAEPYATLEEYNYIGKRGVRRLDGYVKVSGEALYTRDIELPGMLYAKPLRSPYAHARIKSMDTSKAEDLPGVKAILKHDDPELEGEGYTSQWFTYCRLLWGTAYFQEMPMGVAVCAESEEIVDEALRLIEIEWEVLPFVLGFEEALESGAPIAQEDLNPDNNVRSESLSEVGDIEAGFAEADKVIEFRMYRRVNTYAGVEPQSCVARWQGDNLEVWVKHQCPYETQKYLSNFHPMNKTRVNVVYQGAMFGGLAWDGYSTLFPRLGMILSKRTGKPVKVMYDGSHFYGTGDEPGVYYLKVGAKNDGTITAVKVESFGTRGSVGKMMTSTKIPNFYDHNIFPHMNKGPDHCFRHGAVGCNVQTVVFDHVAGELGLDPTEVALLNDGCGPGMAWASAELVDHRHDHGMEERHSLKECIDAGKAAIDRDNKWHPPGTKELHNGKMHGLAFTWTYEWSPTPGQTFGSVLIRSDGTVSIFSRHTDFGVSTETTLSQIAADEIGMKYEDVNHVPFYDVGGDLQEDGGSGGLVSNSPTVVRASRKVKQQLLELALKPVPWSFSRPPRGPFFPGLEPEDLGVKDSVIFEKANPGNKFTVKEVVNASWGQCMRDMANEPVMAWDWSPPLPGVHYYMCRQTHFMEVEVDTETGQVEITKVVNVNDVGKVINPEAAEAQQYGGTYMGLGRSGFEEEVYDPQTGAVLNDNLGFYPIPTLNDIGPIETILVETGLGYGPYGLCGIGEDIGACCTALFTPAVYNAIGKWVDDSPVTAERVLKALGKA